MQLRSVAKQALACGASRGERCSSVSGDGAAATTTRSLPLVLGACMLQPALVAWRACCGVLHPAACGRAAASDWLGAGRVARRVALSMVLRCSLKRPLATW